MKNKDLQSFMNGLNSVSALKGKIFARAAGKNLNKVNSTINEINSQREFTSAFKEYQEKRNKILHGLALLDDDGQPKFSPDKQSYLFADVKEVEAVVKEFEAENKEIIDDQKVLDEDFEKLMEEQIDFKIYKVLEENVPDDINVGQSSLIDEMITDGPLS